MRIYGSMFFNHKSIFFKAVILFLLMFVPLYAFNLIVNMREFSKAEERVNEVLMRQLQQHIIDFEREIEDITKMQEIFINDSDFLTIVSIKPNDKNDYESINAMRNIVRKLKLMSNMRSNISTVTSYISKINWKIDSSGRVGFFEQDMIDIYYARGDGPLKYWDSKLMINYFRFDKTYAGSIPLINISVELSEESLARDLEFLLGYNNGGSGMVNFSEEWNIKNGNKDNNIHQSIAAEIQKSIAAKPDAYISDAYQFKNKRQKYVATYVWSEYLKTAVYSFYPQSNFADSVGTYKKWVWAISLYALGVIVVFSVLIYRFIEKPLINLASSFKEVQEGNLDITINHKTDDEFKFVYERFNAMTSRLKHLINQVYEQKIRVRNAELKQLQYQVTPHFLYNNFYTITKLTKMKDCESAYRLSKNLAQYYSYISRGWGDDVPLKTEIEHVQNYIEIQKMRFMDRIRVDIDPVPASWSDHMIPKLILLPVIENCFKHGLKNKIETGIIKISISDFKGYIVISIEDNGDEFTSEDMKRICSLLDSEDKNLENAGLLNVHKRIQIKYGMKYGLKVFTSTLGGLGIGIRIPKFEEE